MNRFTYKKPSNWGFGTNPNNNVWQNCILKYGIMTAVIIGICIFILSIIMNPQSAIYNIDKYFFVIIIPLILIFAVLLNDGNNNDGPANFFKIMGLLLAIGIGIYFYSKTTAIGISSVYSKWILITLISLIGLVLIYKVSARYISRLTGWPGFFGQLFFFIPCMLYDFWIYLFEQFKMTSIAIYVIIFLEILLILTYFYLPTITKSVTGINNGKQLLNEPYRLNKGPHVIATSDDLKVPDNTEKSLYRNNYCISMWIFLNPQNASKAGYNVETELFKYGYTDDQNIEHVKPMIRYYGGGDSTDSTDERDKYVFYFSKYPPKDIDNTDSYELSIPNQRWNQFVFNYNRNNVDLFINGNLERSFSVISTYNDLDQITVGSLKGLDGSICNVEFFNHPLSASQITFAYNTMVGKNPPVNI